MKKTFIFSLILSTILFTTPAHSSWETWSEAKGEKPAVVFIKSEGGTCIAQWAVRAPDNRTYVIAIGLNVGQDALFFQFRVIGIPKFPRKVYDITIDFGNGKSHTRPMHSDVTSNTGEGYLYFSTFLDQPYSRRFIKNFRNTREIAIGFNDFRIALVPYGKDEVMSEIEKCYRHFGGKTNL